jgi:hypothetical protein
MGHERAPADRRGRGHRGQPRADGRHAQDAAAVGSSAQHQQQKRQGGARYNATDNALDQAGLELAYTNESESCAVVLLSGN